MEYRASTEEIVLKEAGDETSSPVIPTTAGRMTFVQDPNSVRICLIEHSKEYRKKYLNYE